MVLRNYYFFFYNILLKLSVYFYSIFLLKWIAVYYSDIVTAAASDANKIIILVLLDNFFGLQRLQSNSRCIVHALLF